MWRFLPGVSKISASKEIPLLITARQQRSVDLAMLMFVRMGGAGLGGEGGGGGGRGVLMFSVFVWN